MRSFQILKTLIARRDPNHYNFYLNVLPGTTSAANVKSKFLKEIITGNIKVEEISTDFAYELLSHMKGGPSIEVLLDLAPDTDSIQNRKALDVLKHKFSCMRQTWNVSKRHMKKVMPLQRTFSIVIPRLSFTNLPKIPEKIELVTFVAGIGDISTDLLSPGGDAHSRSDRELHGKSMFDHDIEKQKELVELQKRYPEKGLC